MMIAAFFSNGSWWWYSPEWLVYTTTTLVLPTVCMYDGRRMTLASFASQKASLHTVPVVFTTVSRRKDSPHMFNFFRIEKDTQTLTSVSFEHTKVGDYNSDRLTARKKIIHATHHNERER